MQILSRSGMQARVQGERPLGLSLAGFSRSVCDKNQVPAMRRNRARDQHETVCAECLVPECLLSWARNARPQPVRVRHIVRTDDMDGSWIGALMDRDLQGRRSRIQRALDRTGAVAVPAAADPIGALAAIIATEKVGNLLKRGGGAG